MKLSRPDTASLALAALCVLAIAALALLHIAIPDVLPGATYIALGIGGGTSLNSPKADPAAATLARLEALIGGARRSSTPAPAPAPRSPAPAPAPAVNGNGVPR